MAKDSFRSWITLAVITPLAFILPLTLGAQFTWPVTRPLVLTYLLLFLVTFAVFVALTWITFRGHDPASLAHIVRESTPRSRAEKRHQISSVVAVPRGLSRPPSSRWRRCC